MLRIGSLRRPLFAVDPASGRGAIRLMFFRVDAVLVADSEPSLPSMEEEGARQRQQGKGEGNSVGVMVALYTAEALKAPPLHADIPD